MAAHELTFSRFAIPGIPVFLYHDVTSSNPGDRYTLSLPMLCEHLSFLRDRGLVVAELSELARISHVRSVVLTFDDGFASHYQCVFPALLDRGLTATFFVTTALVGSPGYLTWSQLREMSAAGMTIGSHGHEHIDHSGLEPETARCELYRSRLALEDAVGRPALIFAAPYGFLSRSLIEAALQSGFRRIGSSHPWPASAESIVVSRLNIYRSTDEAQFGALATRSPFPLLACRARTALLHLPKQLLLRASPGLLGVNVHQEIG